MIYLIYELRWPLIAALILGLVIGYLGGGASDTNAPEKGNQS